MAPAGRIIDRNAGWSYAPAALYGRAAPAMAFQG